MATDQMSEPLPDSHGPATVSPPTNVTSNTSDAQSKTKTSASKPRKRFVGKNTGPSSSSQFSSSSRTTPHSSIPQDILQDKLLNEAIAQNLPKNYEFEVHKTIWNVKKWDCKMVGLQMPEGLLMWACVLSDIIERFTSAQTVILGDVTYGACCIDDYTALALGCDMLVHYGHSCLVPIDTTTIRTLYVFVEISIDPDHLARTIRRNFPSDRELFVRDVVGLEEDGKGVMIGSVIGGRRRIEGPNSGAEKEIAIEDQAQKNIDPNREVGRPVAPTRLALVSTIQFAAALNKLKEDLSIPLAEDITHSVQDVSKGGLDGDAGLPVMRQVDHPNLDTGRYEINVPRSKPLSPGEILGCTAPRLKDVDAILYLADGRFHLEAIMIANPSMPAFRYDPYSKKLTREWYDHQEMKTARGKAIKDAKATLTPLHAEKKLIKSSEGEEKPSEDTNDQVWGVILGTLGRQGSLLQMEAILRQLDTRTPYMPILLSELNPAKLALFNEGSKGSISAFVQTSCPRLSIDWGYAFEKPLLSPYEAAVVLGRAKGWEEDEESGGRYPMDFYEAGSTWAVSRVKGKETVWPI